jgi:hypothetical protein
MIPKHAALGVTAVLLATVLTPHFARGQGGPPPGVAVPAPFFVLDLAGTPLDEFPSAVRALNGVMTVVDKSGQHMLKASSPSEFLITLPQPLPADFTLELDLIPKGCCAPDDIMLEGTPTMNRGIASAQLTWHPERISVVGGSADMYQSAMPADLAASTPGNLTRVVVEFSGPTIKLYTNGRRLYTLDKQFARGRVLRVWLGGADDGLNAVYLAGLRMTAGTGLGIIARAGGSQPSTPVPSPAGSAPSPLGSNPLPVVPPSSQPPQPQQQQTASQSYALTGTLSPAVTPVVTVTRSASGPLVDWTPVVSPGTYAVKRWRIDDVICCNNASPTDLTAGPWLDSWPTTMGTFVYSVTLTTSAGTATGQTQMTLQPSPVSAPPTNAGTAAPSPPPPPTAPTSPAVQTGTVPTTSRSAPAALAGPPAPTGLSVTGTPTTATVQWSPVSGATQYEVRRWVLGTSGPWTAVTPSPITATTSPVDVLPDFRVSYTYQVLAYQANGSFGAATVNYTPPQPADPTGFKASVFSVTSVLLSWQAAPWVSEYLVSGPGIPLSTTTTATSYTVSGAPYGANVYQVASVFRPGGVLTVQSAWPSVTAVIAQSAPISGGGVAGGTTGGTTGGSTTPCACSKTGPFAAPAFTKITGGSLQAPFTQQFSSKSAGTFTVSAASVASSVMLDVKDDKGQSVFSVNDPAAWGRSADGQYFLVAATPASSNAGSAVSVYRVARGPAHWPVLIGTTVYGDGQWGFSPEGSMFIVTRFQNAPIQFSLEAYNLGASTPSSAVLHQSDLDVFAPTVTISPCGDRLLYFYWDQLQPTSGTGTFYQRTSFGSTPATKLTEWDHVTAVIPTASLSAGTTSSGFEVQLKGLVVKGTTQTSFPSLQCTP